MLERHRKESLSNPARRGITGSDCAYAVQVSVGGGEVQVAVKAGKEDKGMQVG